MKGLLLVFVSIVLGDVCVSTDDYSLRLHRGNQIFQRMQAAVVFGWSQDKLPFNGKMIVLKWDGRAFDVSFLFDEARRIEYLYEWGSVFYLEQRDGDHIQVLTKQ